MFCGRGCWGLDDYQFAPYLVGAAQLSGHPRLRPKSAMDADIRSMFGPEYVYLAAVDHVHTLKVTSFAEHSPMLYDITAVKVFSFGWSSKSSLTFVVRIGPVCIGVCCPCTIEKYLASIR